MSQGSNGPGLTPQLCTQEATNHGDTENITILVMGFQESISYFIHDPLANIIWLVVDLPL
jgi:hypothetical protein